MGVLISYFTSCCSCSCTDNDPSRMTLEQKKEDIKKSYYWTLAEIVASFALTILSAPFLLTGGGFILFTAGFFLTWLSVESLTFYDNVEEILDDPSLFESCQDSDNFAKQVLKNCFLLEDLATYHGIMATKKFVYLDPPPSFQ